MPRDGWRCPGPLLPGCAGSWLESSEVTDGFAAFSSPVLIRLRKILSAVSMYRDEKETVRRNLRRFSSFSSPGATANWCPLAEQGAEQRAQVWEEKEKQTTTWGERENIRVGVFLPF